MSDNYPAGAANDPNAPYNQPDDEQEYVDVEVTISQTLHRTTAIQVVDYVATKWEDAEPDGEGGVYRTGGIDYDFSDSNFQAAYEEQQYGIDELLEVLEEYLEADRDGVHISNDKEQIELMLESCRSWIVDETEVVKE